MLYRLDNYDSGIITECRDLAVYLACKHVSQASKNFRGRIGTDDPAEFLRLLESQSKGFSAEPVDAVRIDSGDINGTANLIAT